jgi:hypothetical protein
LSDEHPNWRIAGTYLEACNCDPICPCRKIDGVTGGRSTHGVCMGALSWQIEAGHAGNVDLAGLRVLLASRYDDDEAGSPWSFHLYLDERADDQQQDALRAIFTGELGGSAEDHFPWAWKESRLLGVQPAPIEIDHTRGRGWFRTGDRVSVRVRGPFAETATVTCVIPGHDRSGREVRAELISVQDEGLAFELTDVCGYESTFDYRG